jgi:hypothetical protein
MCNPFPRSLSASSQVRSLWQMSLQLLRHHLISDWSSSSSSSAADPSSSSSSSSSSSPSDMDTQSFPPSSSCSSSASSSPSAAPRSAELALINGLITLITRDRNGESVPTALIKVWRFYCAFEHVGTALSWFCSFTKFLLIIVAIFILPPHSFLNISSSISFVGTQSLCRMLLALDRYTSVFEQSALIPTTRAYFHAEAAAWVASALPSASSSSSSSASSSSSSSDDVVLTDASSLQGTVQPSATRRQ